MNRKAIAILLIAVIAFSLAGWLIYDYFNQAQGIPEPATEVEISEFHWATPSESLAEGAISRNMVNITIQNSGTTNVTGLTLTVGAFLNGSEVLHSAGFNKTIDLLPAGESLEISYYVYSYVAFRPEGAECVSTLLQGDVVLDSRIDPITWD